MCEEYFDNITHIKAHITEYRDRIKHIKQFLKQNPKSFMAGVRQKELDFIVNLVDLCSNQINTIRKSK